MQPNTPNEIEAGSHKWWLEKFTKGLPTIITSSRTGVPELHPEFIEALTQLNASRTAEMRQQTMREVMSKLRNQFNSEDDELSLEEIEVALYELDEEALSALSALS